MTAADEIRYNDLSDVERAALAVTTTITTAATTAANLIRARVDADNV